MKPRTLCLIKNFITEKQEKDLLAWIEAQSWDQRLKRFTQHYGYEYDYKSRKVPKRLGLLPPKLQRLAKEISKKANCGRFSQAIVNNYQQGQGISLHTDSVVFGPVIASISLLSQVTIRLKRANALESFKQEIPPKSLYILKDEFRFQWKHGISYHRARRISITFRQIT